MIYAVAEDVLLLVVFNCGRETRTCVHYATDTAPRPRRAQSSATNSIVPIALVTVGLQGLSNPNALRTSVSLSMKTKREAAIEAVLTVVVVATR